MATIDPELLGRVKSVVSHEARIPPEQIALEAHLYNDLGLDSEGLVGLVIACETEFSIDFPDELAGVFVSDEPSFRERVNILKKAQT